MVDFIKLISGKISISLAAGFIKDFILKFFKNFKNKESLKKGSITSNNEEIDTYELEINTPFVKYKRKKTRKSSKNTKDQVDD